MDIVDEFDISIIKELEKMENGLFSDCTKFENIQYNGASAHQINRTRIPMESNL
jgi:hypothetical protein